MAVAENSLACFTHWRARFVPRGAPAAAPGMPGSRGGRPAAAGGLVGAAAPVARPGAPPAALADGSRDEDGGANGGANASGGGAAAAARVASALPHVQHELDDREAALKLQRLGREQEQEQQAGGEAGGPLAAARGAAAAALAAAASAAAAAAPQGPRPFEVEGVEVDLFNEQLLLQGIWVFRGALDAERPLFLEQQRREEEARHASELAAQEALRAERRAQREQQLQELLAWATAGQQHFESYISHLKRQIAWQREQLTSRAGGGRSSSESGSDSDYGG